MCFFLARERDEETRTDMCIYIRVTVHIYFGAQVTRGFGLAVNSNFRFARDSMAEYYLSLVHLPDGSFRICLNYRGRVWPLWRGLRLPARHWIRDSIEASRRRS